MSKQENSDEIALAVDELITGGPFATGTGSGMSRAEYDDYFKRRFPEAWAEGQPGFIEHHSTNIQ